MRSASPEYRYFVLRTVYSIQYTYVLQCGWSKKRRDDGTNDGTPGGQYAMGHCPVIVYVRWTHDGTLARGFVQATGQTMRHV